MPGFESYDREIPELLERGSIPGAAIAVAYRGRIVFARGYGYADRETSRPIQPDTRLRIGSISKTVTAARVLKLVEEHQLALETRAFPELGYPVPTYAGAQRDPRLDRVTMRQLLNHTGGWDFDRAPNPLTPGQVRFDATSWPWHVAQVMRTASPASAEDTVRFMVGQPLQAEPGTSWSYTNFAYLALGRLIEQKTGLAYETAVQRFLADSYISGLAIGGTQRDELASDEAAYYDHPNAPWYYLYNQFENGSRGPLVPRPYAWSVRGSDACGGWTASAIELLRFMLALDGLNGTPPLLNSESIAAMRTATPLSTFLHYGLGWCVSNAANTDPQGSDGGHGGSHYGSTSYALRSADGEWHMVALLNGSVDASDGANVNLINTTTAAALHRLPDFATTPPAHDFTWNTLGWEAWQRKHLAAADSAPLDDADRDGLPNLLEYATGLDPTGIDAAPPATLTVGEDEVPVFTYRRLILEYPLDWLVETGGDGQPWQAATAAVRQSTLNSDGTLSVSVALPARSRARLRVHQAASGREALFEPIQSPRAFALAAGESTALSILAPADVTLQWRRNGVLLPGATGPRLTITNAQPADAGIYTVDVGGEPAATVVAAIVAFRSTAAVTGAARLAGTDIRHANGNIYDQALLTGSAATITADAGQVARISYLDLNDDIVQVEFSGAGSLTLALADAAAPALPRNYHQDVRYVKGHATILIADADETTNVSVFTVGRANAVNQALFKADVVYDGIADLAALAIQSRSGKFAGVYLGNAHLFAAHGATGVYAPGVQVAGPARLGGVSAFDRALPVLVFGSLGELAITGSDLYQDNGAAVQTLGLRRIAFTAGGKSDGTGLPTQRNRGRLVRFDHDVTGLLVGP
ncbi:serine hydrolase [Opitutus terrae]|uniref:serine hydrolase n=1 Tax=Opitutus terrae TaxID=107709 RepID=UPI0002DB085B|nr:serine hydrolase [Opitutus terrae]